MVWDLAVSSFSQEMKYLEIMPCLRCIPQYVYNKQAQSILQNLQTQTRS